MTEAFRIKGHLLKTALLANEWYDDVDQPEQALAELRRHADHPDLFSFIQRPPNASPPCCQTNLVPAPDQA